MAALSSILLGATLLNTAVSYPQAKKQDKAMSAQMDLARQEAARQEQRAVKAERQGEAEMNKANRRQPNAGAILSAAQQAGKSGPSGTMLTGPSGVAGDLSLGKSSLLGA